MAHLLLQDELWVCFGTRAASLVCIVSHCVTAGEVEGSAREGSSNKLSMGISPWQWDMTAVNAQVQCLVEMDTAGSDVDCEIRGHGGLHYYPYPLGSGQHNKQDILTPRDLVFDVKASRAAGES